MKWEKLYPRLFLSIFIIIILTIIVYHICDKYQYVIQQVERHHRPPKNTKISEWLMPDLPEEPPEPPAPEKPVGYTVRASAGQDQYFFKTDRTKWLDDTKKTFEPFMSTSSLVENSTYIGAENTPNDSDDIETATKNDGEPIIEGFVELADFFQFLEFLFEVVIAMICISLTLPIHIFEYAIGIVHFTIAFFWFLVNLIGNIFTTFSDFNQMMNDISRCGMTMNKNLPYCAVWYIIDLIGYLAIMIFVWLPTAIVRILTFGKLDLNNMFISIMGVSGSGYRDTNGNPINRDGILAIISKKFVPFLGFDPLHFPPSVMQKCYSCNIMQDLFQVLYDMTVGFINTTQKPMEFAGEGLPWLWRAFYLDAFMGRGSFCSV